MGKANNRAGVYMIISPYNRIYVGSSVNIQRRWNQYKYLRDGEQPKLRASILKYGIKNHRFIVLEYCDHKDRLNRERYFCLKHNVLHRFNLNSMIPSDGEMPIIMSEETKKKIGDAHRGKVISEKQKEALRLSLVGSKQTQEHINKRKMVGKNNPAYGNKWNVGRKLTSEQIRNISERMTGNGLLGENNNAKAVINTKTNEIYGSAKEVAIMNGYNYSTFKSYLNPNSKLKNKTDYIYFNLTQKP